MENLNDLREYVLEDVKNLFGGVSEESQVRVAELIVGLALIEAGSGDEIDAKKFFGQVITRAVDAAKKGQDWGKEVGAYLNNDLLALYNKAVKVEADPIPVFMANYELDRSSARKLVNIAKTLGATEATEATEQDSAIPAQGNAEGPAEEHISEAAASV